MRSSAAFSILLGSASIAIAETELWAADGTTVHATITRPQPRRAVTSGIGVDIVAERAYLRTGFNSGTEVSIPAPGQPVVFHGDWRVDGVGGPFSVSTRALIDGQVFCIVAAAVEGGDSLTSFCSASWTSVAGIHTLRWEFDSTGAVIESDESNNLALRTWNSGGQANVAARRAYLRDGPNSGAEVTAPGVGESAFFHLDWSAAGLPGTVDVPLHALLDGQLFCTGALAAPSGNSSVWCTNPWQATAGEHTLLWVLDPDDAIGEVNELDNEADVVWRSGTTPSPTQAPPTPTRTATRTPTQSPSRTPSPTASGTATRTAGSPSPTRTRSSDSGFYARGDSDCSLTHTATDVVAAVRALGGAPGCGNADCDRDGRTTGADVDCTARCLFGRCAVVDAPGVTMVEAASAPQIVPGSLFTVHGSNFGGETVTRVTVAGVDAEVVEVSADTITAVAPVVAPGTHDVIVHRDDVDGAAVTVTIAAPVPVGERDGLADLIALLTETVTRFAALDLGAIYADEDLPAVRAALDSYRAQLQAINLQSSDLTPDIRATLDAIVDGSGVPEVLRQALAALGSASGARAVVTAADGATVAVLQFGRAVRAGAGLTQVITPVLRGGALAGTLLRSAAGGVVAAIVVTALVEGGAAALTPVMLDIAFTDESGMSRPRPTSAGTVHVLTQGNLTGTISLLATTAYGTFRRAGTSCGTGCVDFRLPDAPGFCGAVGFRLARGPVKSSDSVGTTIQPELLDVDPTSAGFGDNLDLYVRGVAPCDNNVRFDGPLGGRMHSRTSDLTIPGVSDHNRLRTAAGVPVDGRLRELPPGHHKLFVEVQNIASAEDISVRLRTRITGMAIDCFPTALVLQPAEPSVSRCHAKPLPADTLLFPIDTEFVWTSTDPGVVKNPIATLEAEVDASAGIQPGTAEITAEARPGDVLLARSSAVSFSVEDKSPPELHVLQGRPLSPCESIDIVLAGDTVRLVVIADDNYLMKTLRVSAPEIFVSDAAQLLFCFAPDPHDCIEGFDIHFREDAPDGEAVVRVEASDSAGNVAEHECSYRVLAVSTPTSTPTPTSTMPPTVTPTPAPLAVRFLKVADPQTSVPGGSGTFSSSGFIEYVVDDGRVLFIGFYGSNAVPGIYMHDGSSLGVLANRDTVIPGMFINGQPRRFDGFYSLSVDDGVAVFDGGLRGLLFSKDTSGFASPVQRLIDLPVLPPHNFGFFTVATTRAGAVAFLIDDGPAHTPAIYFAAEPVTPNDLSNLVLIADGTTPIPGGSGTFTTFPQRLSTLASDSTAGDTIAFIGRGTGGQEGAYLARPGAQPSLIADKGAGLSGFCAVAVDGDAVAFVSAQGVFLQRSGQALLTIADIGTRIPEAAGQTFDRFGCAVAFDAGVIVFAAEVTNQFPVVAGLYAWSDGALRKLVATGDVVDGRTVSRAEIVGDQSIDHRLSDGNRIIDVGTQLRVAGFTPALYRVTLEGGLP